jgi:hypothetical protein
MLTVPLIIACAIAGSELDHLLALGAVLYAVAMLVCARGLNAALRSSIQLGVERLSLLASTARPWPGPRRPAGSRASSWPT